MSLEGWFAIGAGVMTVLAGAVLVPVLRRAMREPAGELPEPGNSGEKRGK